MPKKPRYSPQRDTILQIILQAKAHLSVDDIYQAARAQMPRISLATVYRNLKQLEELKQISQMQGHDQVAYFEAYAEPHHHFICRQCHSIRNLEAPNVKVCTGCISAKVPVTVERIVTTLYGLCENCQNEYNPLRVGL